MQWLENFSFHCQAQINRFHCWGNRDDKSPSDAAQNQEIFLERGFTGAKKMSIPASPKTPLSKKKKKETGKKGKRKEW